MEDLSAKLVQDFDVRWIRGASPTASLPPVTSEF